VRPWRNLEYKARLRKELGLYFDNFLDPCSVTGTLPGLRPRSALSWRESEMSNAENLRKIFHDVQANGKFEKYEFLAVLSNLIDIADRVERVEIACKIEES